MRWGVIKDFLIAVVVVGTLADIGGHVVQYLSGGSGWLPDGHQSAGFWTAAYLFSRYPIWKPR